MDTETAANPADDGVVTLSDPIQDASSQAASTEATAPAGGTEADLESLTKEALGETEATPEEEIEIEYDGETRKLPPKWKDAFLRHQDYTRKTMDLGEQRKAIEQERETVRTAAAQIAQDFQAQVQLHSLQSRIQELQSADTSYWTADEVQAGIAELNALQQQAVGLSGHLAQRDQHRQASFQQERTKCLSEAAARVPNFSDQRRTELEELAVSVGFDPRDVQALNIPGAYEVLHYADIGKKFIERQRKAAQMKAAHAGSPATMLGSANAGGKSPEDMSMAEYAAWREAGNG